MTIAPFQTVLILPFFLAFHFLCVKALELDPNNEKALFRRGEALVVMKEFDRARADFQRVTQLYPANKAAKSQIVLCQKHIKAQHEKDKRLYANMFQKFAERDAKVSVYGY